MNTRQLQYVLVLAHEKNFSEAANKLMISQPSLSQYIQKLEKELGTELFERTTPLKLTYTGEIYVDTAKKILCEEKEMNERISDVSSGAVGKIVIGTGFFNSIIVLPSLISIYRKQFPDVEIMISEDIEPNLKSKADSDDLDIVISTKLIEDSHYEKIHLMREEFLVAVPIGMNLGISGENPNNLKTIPLEEVRDIPFVMLESKTVMREAINSICNEKAIQLKQVAMCTSATAAYSMVKAGVGATIIPMSTYRIDYSPYVCYYRLEDISVQRELILYYKKNRYIPQFMKIFIDETQKYFRHNY